MEKLIIDLETTVRNKGEKAVGTLGASPFCRDNQIVAHGINVFDTTTTWYGVTKRVPYADLLKHCDTIVAHNMQFELKWLLREYKEEFLEWLANGGKVWCTMVGEYILTGMIHKFPALDALAPKYGGHLKDEKIKEYWDAGYDTTDIPEDELIEYLRGDVDNTRKVYLGQVAKIEELGMQAVVDLHMEMLLGVCMMEYNGCRFDVHYAREEIARLDKEQEINTGFLISVMKDIFEPEVWDNLNPESGDQLSVALFGGSYLVDGEEIVYDQETMEPYVFKSGLKKGQIKTKKCQITKETAGFGITPKKSWKLKKEGFYTTKEDVIKELAIDAVEPKLVAFLDGILTARRLSKDNGTYFQGYTSLVYSDGYIHHQLNTSQTVTGRLSSSKPNMQNLSGGKD